MNDVGKSMRQARIFTTIVGSGWFVSTILEMQFEWRPTVLGIHRPLSFLFGLGIAAGIFAYYIELHRFWRGTPQAAFPVRVLTGAAGAVVLLVALMPLQNAIRNGTFVASRDLAQLTISLVGAIGLVVVAWRGRVL